MSNLLLIISFLLDDIIFILFVYLIYQSYTIPGWSLNQILFLFGIFYLINGVQEMLFNGARWDLLENVRTGRLDYDLIRPKSLLKIYGISLFIPSINDVVIGLILMISSHIVGNIINLILLATVGIIFLEGFNILTIAIGIKYIEVNNFWNVGNILANSSKWPIKVFPHWFRLLIFIFPVVLVGYAPASAYMFGGINNFVLPITISIFLFILSVFLLKYSIKEYQSAGG